MSPQPPPGRLLGQARPQMPEVVIYPVADVGIEVGGLDIGDATHYLRITLPLNVKEIRIPYNGRSLRDLCRALEVAVTDNTNHSQMEGNAT